MMRRLIAAVLCLSSASAWTSSHPKSVVTPTGLSKATPEVEARQARILGPLATVSAFVASPLPSRALQGKGAFDEQLKEHFPGSLTSSVITLRVVATLKKLDYKPFNLLMGSSVPADETLTTPSSLIALLQSQLANKKSGGVYALGGLGGLPFAGTAGMQSLLSHSAGKVLLVFGPNVGITESGKLGKLVRSNTDKETDAGVMNLLTAKSSSFDYEQDYIKKRITEKLGGSIPNDNAGVAKVTMALYDLSKELLESEIKEVTSSPGFWDSGIQEITLLGGIFVNRNEKAGEDCFQPLTMKTLTPKGQTSLYDPVFGDLPTPRNQVN